MKKFILSHLHIGYKDALYDVMDQALIYIRRESKACDEIWGLGDWFHMYEISDENESRETILHRETIQMFLHR